MATKKEPYNYMNSEEQEKRKRQKNLNTAKRIINQNGLTSAELGLQAIE